MKAQYKKIKSVNEYLTLFLFEQEALIYSSKSQKVYLLNATGIFIWLHLEEGLNQEQVKQAALDKGVSDSPELEKLLAELLSLFQSALIKPACLQEADQVPTDVDTDQEQWLTKITPTSQPMDDNHEIYTILDTDFVFSFPNKSVEQLVKPLLAQFSKSLIHPQEKLELKPEKSHARWINLQIITASDKHYQILINGFSFSWLIPEKRLLSFLLDRLRKIAFYFSDYYLAAHAAVLAKADQCFMFPAISYSGKSTLSAALIGNGYSYLSDEIAVLDNNFKARPVPLGLGLKSGSWPAVARYLPQLAKAPAQERWDGVAIKYLAMPFTKVTNTNQPKGGDLAQQRLAVTQLIFPHYTQGAKACLRPITLPQTLYALYQAGYAQAEPLSVARLELILEHLSSLPAYQFVFDDLAQAIHCLESLT